MIKGSFPALKIHSSPPSRKVDNTGEQSVAFWREAVLETLAVLPNIFASEAPVLDEIRVRLRKAVVSRLQPERLGRLTKPLRRLADGSFQRVDRKTAIRLQKRHGIRALRHEPKPSRINEYSEASSSGISRYIDQLKGDNMPSREALENWAKNYVELWNKGDKEAWVENWQKVAPGAFTMMDPVGTPPKHDFVGCCVEPFELFQPSTEFRVDPETMFILSLIHISEPTRPY